MKTSSWVKSLWDKDKFEVTLRVGVIALCGFSLSIASIPNVVPPSQALQPGLMASIFSQILPTLMFALFGALPTVIVMMVVICGFSTMLLAAGTVSDGLFVGIYSVFVLFMTSLYFGKHYNMTSGTANAMISLTGLMGISYLETVQEGGLSTVADFWKEKGTENSSAVWRNFLIAVCWALACMVVGILIPPWRTSRQMISRGLLPAIFKQVNTVLSGGDVDVRSLAKSKSSLKGGKVVMTTLFEPHYFQHPKVDVLTPLKQIVVATDEMIFRSLLVLKWKEGLTEAPNELEVTVLQDSSEILELCGEALSSNGRAQYKTLRDYVNDKAFDQMANVGSLKQTGLSDNPEDSSAYFIYEQVLKVRTATLAYLRAFNDGVSKNTSNQQRLHLLKKSMVIFLVPLIPTMRLVKASALIFQPKKWDFKSILWSVELSAGFIALMAMSVYWDSYADFRIDPADDYIGAVYSGWQLMGYAFAWRPTHEGTIKKGIQRVIGTCFGGFFAWLGIIVCSWSYDNSAAINPYGLIAWLTIFTMICAYFSTLASGVAARSGKDKDHGYVGMYFSLTQSLIALEVFLGAGDKNGLTLNRIVATITGVLMAGVISFLPPHVNGRDPKHTRAYVDALNDAFQLLLRTFADESESSKITSDDFKKSLFSDADSKRQFAVFALNDANMMQRLPFYKVNKELPQLVDDAGVTEAGIDHLLEGFLDVITENRNVNETRTSVALFVDELGSPGFRMAESEFNPKTMTTDVTLGSTYEIAHEIEQLLDALDKMESE